MPLLQPKVYDTIIIGTGLSALTLVKTLLNSNNSLNPLLLESRNRLGGRAHSNTSLNGIVLETGCGALHGFDKNPVAKLCEEYGLETYVPKSTAPMIIGPSGSLTPLEASTLLTSSKTAAYSPSSSTRESLSTTTSLASQVLPTVEHSIPLTSLARMTEIGAGIKLELISAKYFGTAQNISGIDAAVKGGYSSLVNKIYEDVVEKGAEILLEEEVVKVEELGDFVQVTTRKGNSFMAKAVVSTIPLGVLQNKLPTFLPELKDEFKATIQRTKVGVLEKIFLQYSKPWWPSSSTTASYLLLPLAGLRSPPPTHLMELLAHITVSVTNLYFTSSTSNTPAQPILQIYLGAYAGELLSKFKEKEIGMILHSYLVGRFITTLQNEADNGKKVFGMAEPPTKVIITNWLTDENSYGATSSPVQLPQAVGGGGGGGIEPSPEDFKLLCETMWEGKLGWAGEHTDFDHRGSVVGAYVSGVREGERLATYLKGRE